MPFTRTRAASLFAAAVSATLLTSLAIAPTSDAMSLASHAKKGDRVVQVYLARHGQTILNVLGRVQGWTDSPLTDAGRLTATTVGTNLGKEIGKVDKVYSADMMRHYQTADLMKQGVGRKLSVTKDAALREVNFGGWEGSTNAEMQLAGAKHLGYSSVEEAAAAVSIPEFIQAVKDTNPVASLPAENCDDVNARALPALNKIARSDAKGRGTGKVLVVSSGLTIVCVLDALGTEVAFPGISNGAVSLLEYRAGTWTVKSVNDTHYAG
jgi:probable phosphoglycerate mutase